nr:unnamed protein product [Digitaria exilis]
MALARGASLLLLLSLSCWCGAATAARSAPSSSASAAASSDFVSSWCAGTEYPALCGATLSPYAARVGSNPSRLSWAALTVAHDAARDAAASVRAMAAAGHLAPAAAEAAARDCVATLEDAADKLRRSVDAVAARLGGEALKQEDVDGVRTWASAALADAGTCVEGFKGEVAGGASREAVRGHVAGVARLTANALGIVDKAAMVAKPVVVDICRGSCRSVPVPPPSASP